MNTCETCAHWRQQQHHTSGRSNDFLTGECRGVPPARDFTWPRTRKHDSCGSHKERPHFATATGEQRPSAGVMSPAPITAASPRQRQPAVKAAGPKPAGP